MNSATPGAGKTLVYRAEGFYLFGGRCRDPIMNARVLNLTAILLFAGRRPTVVGPVSCSTAGSPIFCGFPMLHGAAVIRRVADDMVVRPLPCVPAARTTREPRCSSTSTTPGSASRSAHGIRWLSAQTGQFVPVWRRTSPTSMVRHVQRSRWSPEQVGGRAACAWTLNTSRDQAFAAAVEDRTHEIESQYDYWKRGGDDGPSRPHGRR